MTLPPDPALTPPVLAEAHALSATTGDEPALADFYRYVWAKSYELASRYCDRDDAEDVAGTLAWRLWQQAVKDPALHATPAAHDGLVRTGTMRLIANHSRNRKLRVQHDNIYMEGEPRETPASISSASVEHLELERALKLALAQLKPRTREAWDLVCIRRMSHAEAARAMGIAVGTINVHVCQARRELKQTVGAYLEHGTMPALIEQSLTVLLAPTTMPKASS